MKTADLIEQAKAAFADHVIRAQGPRVFGSPMRHQWWHIARPGTTQYAAYVTVMSPYLIVQGDIDLCSFAYFSGDTAEGAVAWIGGRDFSHYVCEKASIGMTARELIWKLDADALCRELAGSLKEIRDEVKLRGTLGDWREDALKDAIFGLRHDEDPAQVLHDLCESEALSSADGPYGDVPTARVIYAWAAVRRLHELLTYGKRREAVNEMREED